jgi:hypothetical protein
LGTLGTFLRTCIHHIVFTAIYKGKRRFARKKASVVLLTKLTSKQPDLVYILKRGTHRHQK